MELLAPDPPARGAERDRPPTFSVIIAAYQAAATVGEAIESALGQDPGPQEVIVCDDGSTDDIQGAMEPFVDRVSFLRRPNGGEASAKNTAWRAASGEFVVILDADDTFLPGRLNALGQAARARPDLDILTTDAIIEVDGEAVRRCYTDSFTFPVHDQRQEILKRNFIFGLAAVRRSRLDDVGGFDESIKHTADWELWIRMILTGSAVGLCPHPLARYRLTSGSLSSQRAAMLAGRIATLERAYRNPALTDGERADVMRVRLELERDLRLRRVREALAEGKALRAEALAIARTREFSFPSRLKAATAAVSPGLARRLLARRPRETTAGILLPRDE